MASNEEAKPKAQEIEKSAESTDNTSTECSQGLSELKSSKPSENDVSEFSKCSQKEKKKRPISTAFHGSLKRHTPVFFNKKRQSESSGTLNENMRKSASEMWNDVKYVFRRLSLKKDNSHEKEDKEAPLNQNENSAPVGKTEGVDEVDKTSNETVLKGSDTVTNDKENTSKEVIVLENGSVEITEEIETNNNENEELAENKQEMTHDNGEGNTNHEEVTNHVTSQDEQGLVDSQVTDNKL